MLIWPSESQNVHCLCIAKSLCVSPLGCAVCGVTIARSNVSRMDPNHKMCSAINMLPLLGRDRSLSLSSRAWAWSHLKNHGLGNKCTVRTMNVPLFNSFLCCKTSAGTKASVRILKHQTLILHWSTVIPVLQCGDVSYRQYRRHWLGRRPMAFWIWIIYVC